MNAVLIKLAWHSTIYHISKVRNHVLHEQCAPQTNRVVAVVIFSVRASFGNLISEGKRLLADEVKDICRRLKFRCWHNVLFRCGCTSLYSNLTFQWTTENSGTIVQASKSQLRYIFLIIDLWTFIPIPCTKILVLFVVSWRGSERHRWSVIGWRCLRVVCCTNWRGNGKWWFCPSESASPTRAHARRHRCLLMHNIECSKVASVANEYELSVHCSHGWQVTAYSWCWILVPRVRLLEISIFCPSVTRNQNWMK